MTSKTLDLEKRLLGQWNALVRRARLGRDYKAAAFTMSSYADPDGTGIRLSVARYAVDLDVSYSTARRYLTWLRKVGLVEMTRAGNRRKGTASEYRLILGPDVLEDLDVLSPTEHKRRADEMREAERDGSRGRAAKARVPDQRSHEVSVERGPEGAGPDADHRSSERALMEPINAQMGVDQRSPWMTYTPFRTHLSVEDRPSRADEEDLCTAARPSRAPAGELLEPESTARPTKCPDGLSPAMRPDGKPECPICRRRLSRPGIAIPPPPEERMAPVIDLHTREVS